MLGDDLLIARLVFSLDVHDCIGYCDAQLTSHCLFSILFSQKFDRAKFIEAMSDYYKVAAMRRWVVIRFYIEVLFLKNSLPK